MKCEVAKDLMPLDIEGMCSEETTKELLRHIKSCPECSKEFKKLKEEFATDEAVVRKLYKKESKTYVNCVEENGIHENYEEENEEVKNYEEENRSEINPLKKIKKRLLMRKIAMIVLGVFLVAVLGVVGYLSYGEVTNKCMSFSMIANVNKVKSVCRDLTEGDTEALLEVIFLSAEDVFHVHNNGVSNEYRESILKSMDEAYEYYFAGRDIEVRIEDTWMTPYEEAYGQDIANVIDVGFYEGDELVHVMSFYQAGANKFGVSESVYSDAPCFTSQILPYDDALLNICLRYHNMLEVEKIMNGEAIKQYGSSLGFAFKKGADDAEILLHREEMFERLNAFYDTGWYFKDIMFEPYKADETQNGFVFRVWFLAESMEGDGKVIMEQSFVYRGASLFIMDEMKPSNIAEEGEVAEEVKTQLLEMFR